VPLVSSAGTETMAGTPDAWGSGRTACSVSPVGSDWKVFNTFFKN
jgi:hypothetical protein